MKNTTRAAAVAASVLLAVSGAPAAANALDVGSIIDAAGGLLPSLPGSSDLNIPGSSDIPSSADLNPLSGSSDIPGSSNLLGGSSVIPGSSNLLGGSSDIPGSSNLLGGSSDIGSTDMAPLSTNLLGGSAAFNSSDLAPLTGSTDMAPLSTNLLGGSAELAPLGSLGMAPIVSSIGMEPLSTELNLLGGSAELPALSANFPDGSTGGIGGSAQEVGEGISGSLKSDSLETLVGSVQSNSAAELITARAGSIESVTGSLTGETGSTAGSSEVLTGSFGDLTQVNGSLTALTGSLEAGSDNATASSGTGSAVGQLSSLETVSSVGGGLLPILSVGGAAAVAGAALGANVQLPPLPGLPLCDLPQAQIDQLAAAGSVDAQQCPDPQN